MWFDRKPQGNSTPASFAVPGSTRAPLITRAPWLPSPASITESEPPPKPVSEAPPPAREAAVSQAPARAPAAAQAPRSLQPARDDTRAAEEAARRELESKYHQALARLETAIEELGAVRSALASEMELQLVHLAGKIARKVVQRELAVAPEIVLELAREGIDALGEKGSLLVRLGTVVDEAATTEFVTRVSEKAPGCRIVFDPELPSGACVVEGQAGRVDESIDERLDNVMRGVLMDHPGS